MLQRIPIYRALQRPHLLMGAERNLVLSAGALSGSLVFVGMTLMSIILGIGIWIVAIMIFQRMAKSDPHMSEVYQRHIKYRSYYPARSTPWRPF